MTQTIWWWGTENVEYPFIAFTPMSSLTRNQTKWLCVWACMCVWVTFVCAYVCICVYVCALEYACACWVCVGVRMCVCVCMCVNMCVYVNACGSVICYVDPDIKRFIPKILAATETGVNFWFRDIPFRKFNEKKRIILFLTNDHLSCIRHLDLMNCIKKKWS